jgi:hypothetical protein
MSLEGTDNPRQHAASTYVEQDAAFALIRNQFENELGDAKKQETD